MWTESAKWFLCGSLCDSCVWAYSLLQLCILCPQTNKQTNKQENKQAKQANKHTDRQGDHSTPCCALYLHVPWSKVMIQHVSIAQYIHKTSTYERASPFHLNTWAETHLDGGGMNILVFPLASIGHFGRHRQCMTVHRCASFG